MSKPAGSRSARLRQSQKEETGAEVDHRWIVTIGIDAYHHLPPLHNAAGDARGIHRLFTQQLDFEAALPPLLDEDATRRALTELLEETLPDLVGEDDALVLFFAGHGRSRRLRNQERGYLAPVEARANNRWSDYLLIDNFFNSLDNINARHVVVILDACHSGFALGKAMVLTRRQIPPYARALQARKSRHILTAALPEQEALDGGPVFGHSLFTGWLIHGLRTGLADRGNKGVIMTSELGQYVQEQVAAYSNGRQTPATGRFAPWADEQGELLFKSLAVPAPAPATSVPQVPPGPSPLQDIWTYRQWLLSEDEPMREFAREELQKLAEGDNPRVARAAQAALKTVPEAVASGPATPSGPPRPPRERRCAALTRKGLPCKNWTRRGSDYCFAHRFQEGN